MRIGKRKGSKPGMVILRTLKILRVSVPNSCDNMFLLSLFLFWSYFCCLGDFSWKWEILLSLFLV